MGKPAARVSDNVAHPLPPVLSGSPGSPNVLIGSLPAWRGMPTAGAAGLQSSKKASDGVVKGAETATKAAAAGGPSAVKAAKDVEDQIKQKEAALMGAEIMKSAGGADIHSCGTPPLPPPPHGPGVVTDGSKTVLINGLPACRMGDTLTEAIGPPNKIVRGWLTVLIGG